MINLPKIYKLKPKIKAPNYGHSLSRDLVGCWLLNELGGSIAHDISGFHNNGSLVGNTHSVPERYGPALDFDGSGDSVLITKAGSRLNITSNSVTIAARVKFDTLGTTAWIAGISEDAAPNPVRNQYFIRKQINDVIRVGISTSVADFFKTGSVSISAGQWYSIIGVYNGSDLRLYVDGIQDGASVAATGTLYSNTLDFTMGIQLHTSPYDLDGQIDYVMVWERALSETEIQQLYSEPFSIFHQIGHIGLVVEPYIRLKGAISSSYALGGSLTLIRPLVGTITAAGTLTGKLTRTRSLKGTITTAGTLTGRITGTTNLSGTIATAATLTGRITGTTNLSGTIAATGTLTGRISGTVNLSGAISTAGTLTGRVTGTVNLSGTVGAAATLTGRIIGTVNLIGTVAAIGTLTGRVTGTTNLSGTIAAVGALTGNVTNYIGIVGTITATGTLAARLTGTFAIRGGIAAAGTLSGALTRNVWRKIVTEYSTPTLESLTVQQTASFSTIFFIDGINNVIGIGTRSPWALRSWHLVGEEGKGVMVIDRYTNSIAPATIYARKSRGSTTAAAAVQTGDRIGGVECYGYDGDSFEFGAYIGGIVDGAVSDGNVPMGIQFLAPTERMRITSSGRVGIGTVADTPECLLELTGSGTTIFSSSWGGTATYTPTDSDLFCVWNTNDSADYTGIFLQTRTTLRATAKICLEHKGNAYGDLIFSLRDGTNLTEHMRVQGNTGRVGVGTGSPQARFHSIKDTIVGIASVAISSANLTAGSGNFWINEGSRELTFKVVQSDGVVKSFVLTT